MRASRINEDDDREWLFEGDDIMTVSSCLRLDKWPGDNIIL